MKLILFAVIILTIASARAETFESFTRSYPLGTEKKDVVAKEPTATVIPCAVKPIDAKRLTECLVLMRRSSEGAFVTQFYLVDGRIAAILLARKPFPGAPFDSSTDTAFLKRNRKVATFSALRVGKELNPIDVDVEQFAFHEPREVALVVAKSEGSEAWIVDTGIFDPKSFFMEPTPANREKLTKTKEAIEANKKQYGR